MKFCNGNPLNFFKIFLKQISLTVIAMYRHSRIKLKFPAGLLTKTSSEEGYFCVVLSSVVDVVFFYKFQDPSLRDLVTEMFTTTKRCESVIGTMEDYFNTDS